jgi:GT2 family glycosyltransferase
MYRVTVAIVTYRSRGELPECLESLLASDMRLKIVVIDNDSRDGTLELAQEWAAKYPNIVAFGSGGNIGLAAGNNLVIPHLEGDYALMLNPDTILRPNTVSTMVAMLDGDPKIGMVGPKNIYQDGKVFSSYQRAWNLWHVFLWRVVPYSLTRKMYDDWSRYAESEVFYVSGSCLLIRSDLFRAMGGYDPELFLTIEDVCDLGRRARERGYKVVFTPRTEIIHHCSRSGDQVPFLAVLSSYKGSIYYFTKYNGRIGGAAAYAIVTFGCVLKILVSYSKVLIRQRPVDRTNLGVYRKILPELLRRGPKIISAR